MSITPEDVKNYSTFESVKNRPETQLKMDILEAVTYVNSKIEKPLKEYENLPDELEIALLKVAQFYALVNGDESIVKGYKSEKIGDYSYTLSDGSNLSMPDVSSLLNGFIPSDEKKTDGVFLRMRGI
ncbi:hypothetical protein CAI16_02900 [Virgibacillus dokdonensis]|uniref:DUF3199 domain-containing protein n=1 Tax=Virgibacillus dokdonensis TaxID=302167 RepID=A0A3E0WW46_9BACI|nr:DUF3199 family protein [Virgibacillus dokdonensis]RFA37038.1 hypothetical protein CAI16_02900 [Virgibacillus dokdonensis]